jgi:acetylornithine deacetylase
MPGERLEDIDREFFTWFNALLESDPSFARARPKVTFPIRWLPGSAIQAGEQLVQELAARAAAVRGKEPLVEGIEAPCDMYVFHEFGIPAVLWGGWGGNTHNADEYVEIDSLVEAAKVLLTFVCRWCGVSRP